MTEYNWNERHIKTFPEESVALSTKDLHVYYGGKEAIKGIDMQFEKNKITALIGPSGCGKSTYLRSLNRMNDTIDVAKVTGEIMYQGIDINKPEMNVYEVRKHIGMVFQQPNPFPMSIYENVVFGLRINGIKDKHVLDQAVETSLKGASIWEEVKDRLHDSALGLSGGQQQRVCVARVLATSPKIILLDEPTSALDPISAGKIEETLFALKNDYTMVVVTRSMQQASRLSDRTGFFLAGDLLEFGNTKTMFMNPKRKETEDYISGKFG